MGPRLRLPVTHSGSRARGLTDSRYSPRPLALASRSSSRTLAHRHARSHLLRHPTSRVLLLSFCSSGYLSVLPALPVLTGRAAARHPRPDIFCPLLARGIDAVCTTRCASSEPRSFRSSYAYCHQLSTNPFHPLSRPPLYLSLLSKKYSAVIADLSARPIDRTIEKLSHHVLPNFSFVQSNSPFPLPAE